MDVQHFVKNSQMVFIAFI